jgi:formylglycine-generating enzyme required for sulfatase activity
MKTSRCIGWLSLALASLLVTLPAQAARLALVIGNDDYVNVRRLRNAAADADTMAAALRKVGYTVTLQKNRDLRQTKDDVRAFRDRVAGGDEVVLYFSGHGVQLGSDNYLLPVDVRSESESQVRDDGLSLSAVLRDMRGARPALTLAVIDACRNNPFEGRGKAIGEQGLTGVAGASGQMVIYAAGEGQKALDRLSDTDPVKNGLFTRVFVKEMERPGVPIDQVLKNVRVEVHRQAQTVRHEQVPAIYDQVLGNYYFVPGAAPLRVSSAEEVEQEFWNSIKDGRDAHDFRDYERRYPNGRFLPLAQRQLRVLTAAPPVQLASIRPEPALPVVPPQTPQAATVPAPRPAAPAPLACAECPEMVVIPAGSFEMGSNEYTGEKPPHRVSIKSFALGKYEVTQGQWKAVMGSNPSGFKECGDNCPVEQVSWDGIQQYIQKLNASSGQQYRLPSEAEWEYAARAGTSSKYWWGDTASHDYANYGKDECCGGLAQGRDQWTNTAPVGQFPANAFGLHDMHGNVWEWVQDYWHDSYSAAPSDGSAWVAGGDQGKRVLRGGSWDFIPADLRSAIRGRISPDSRIINIGFRLARTLLTP